MGALRRLFSKKLRDIIKEKQKKQIKNQVVNAHHDVSKFAESNVADMRKYGFSFSESGVFNLKENDYREYISTYEAYKPRLKSSPYVMISDDKYLFSLVYGKYIDTPKAYALIQDGIVVDLSGKKLDNSNLYDFLLANNGMVIKDRSGCDGFGVYVFNVNGDKITYKNQVINRNELENIIKKFKNGLVQSKVEQGDFENSIYSGSVNTIRVISMRKKNSYEHEVVAALQRIGTKKSMPVDNFNQGGGSALIDIETGEIGSMTCLDSYDDSGKRVFYDIHPDSGSKINGLLIPNWDSIKQTIIDVTRVLPFFEYIAWDIVLKNDGIAVIETNMKSSLNVFQVHGGMRNSFLGQKYREKGYLEY
ncbi:MAG: hypothetical protein IKJ68_04810 [Clostridia bacterium]|nr:hypothetical protein [Clostridia bacterium]